MSAFGGKADIAFEDQNVRYRPKADIASLGLPPRNENPKPHFARHKSLL
jgi:hypothetical protein